MTLREALRAAAGPSAGAPYPVHLCCGFEPLHLVTYSKAHLRNRFRNGDAAESRPVEIHTGLFGDLDGNVRRALAASGSAPIVIVLEWADIDPRLGLREGYAPKPGDEDSILSSAAGRLAGLQETLLAAAGRRIVLALPAAPLPPWFPGLTGQATAFSLQLQQATAAFAAACALAGVRVAAPLPGPAYDLRGHLHSGFPYTLPFTSALAEAITALLLPPATAKGLITDLDNTLWAGIAGDDGPANLHWSLEKHARHHGLYQQFLAGLAAQGVLVGIASKNDPAPVAEALNRSDVLIAASSFFPIETNWGPKSESIRRIAQAWNIGLDSIVFVDDSPLELAEVRQALPDVACHAFPASDPAAVLELIHLLRRRFAREQATDEDRIRAASLRNAAALTAGAQAASDPETLLAGLEARIAVSFLRDPFDPRSLELINKTNQFNINGERWEESQFRAFLQEPAALLAVVSYEDRFGPLGKIAVAAGRIEGERLRLESWVMSCRAFSRRIEYATLQALFAHTGAREIELVWRATSRNNPTREALAPLCGELPAEAPIPLTRQAFETTCPALYATVS